MKNTFLNEEVTKLKLSDFILRSDRFSMGDECRKFEEKFSKWQGRKYSLLFNSGGSANLALLQSLKNLGKLKDGDRVGFSALTWSTNVMPIIQMNLVPVPVDVNSRTINVMSENLINRLLDVNIKCFFATNVLGYCGDLDSIRKLCDDHDIIFIEDNCEGLGGEYRGIKYGNFGLGSTFSFYVAHHMSTIEGGMFCTDDHNLYVMMTIVRANGWDRNLDDDTKLELRSSYNINEFNAKYSFYDLAYNLRPTEITGFLGQIQLDYLEDSLDKRRYNQNLFNEIISDNDDLILIDSSHISKTTPFGLVILCKDSNIRDRYIKKFIDNGIEVRPIIAGNIQDQPFYGKYVHENYNLEGTDFISSNGFYCGNSPNINPDDIDLIKKCLSND